MLADGKSGGVSGFALYDDYGYINRAKTPAYGQTGGVLTTLATATVATGPNEAVDARALIHHTDIWGGEIYISGQGVYPTGTHYLSRFWTNWATAIGSTATLQYLSPYSYGGIYGQQIEFRHYQTGVAPVFTAMRFPGQWYDQETDLNENWNRYYDPQTGRYLSPEPMLQNPKWVKGEASSGFSAPTYAYARNNPVAIIDPDGLSPGDRDGNTSCPRGTALIKSIKECTPPRGICADSDWANRSNVSKCRRCLRILPTIGRDSKDQSTSCQNAILRACDEFCKAPQTSYYGSAAPPSGQCDQDDEDQQ